MEALIYSNLFKVKINKRNDKISKPTLKEMQDNPRHHLLVFISTNQRGFRYFSNSQYFFRLHFTSGIENDAICCVQWVHFVEEVKHDNCSISTITGKEWDDLHPYNRLSLFIQFHDIEPIKWALFF